MDGERAAHARRLIEGPDVAIIFAPSVPPSHPTVSMARKKQASKQDQTSRRRRRGVDQMIADLEAKIAAIKAREAARQVKADPAVRHARAAARSIDKALSAVKDSAMRQALTSARSTLQDCLDGTGGRAGVSGGGRRTANELQNLAENLLDYVRTHPGQRAEQIASALVTDTLAIRPVMKRLIANGKIVTEGQRRGMTYSAV